ncbi:MAG: hypothetical protein PHQ59_03735 [Candidatus Daviesbacteria bacterium]|nr:hypothetical protein [Candidatus Daviesbacteria bacterium]
MDENSFKKILDEALTPLREDVHDLKEDVHDLKEDVHDLKEDVQTLKVSVLSLEKTVGSYADSYQENQRNINRLDTRLNVVEEELAIEPPEDLKVPHFTA